MLEVHNEHDFTALSWLEPTWTLAVDGVVTQTGSLPPLDLAAGATTSLTVPFLAPVLGAGQVAHLTVGFHTTVDLPWAAAGHLVAWEQVEVGRGSGPSDAPVDEPAGGGGGGVLAAGPLDELDPTISLWRAPIDNETFGPTIGWKHAARWTHLGLRDAATRDDLPSLVTDAVGGSDGRAVSHTVVVPDGLADIARVGVRLRLGSGIDRVEWLGDGPHEGYSDRRAGTRVGRWTTPVDEWPVPYVHPQASGNRTGVRWLRFLADDGTVLLTIDRLAGEAGGDGLDVTVSRWTDEEVADADHLEDLPTRADRDDCYVWLDAAHRGVGSAAVGPEVRPEFQVGPGTYRWSYRLR